MKDHDAEPRHKSQSAATMAARTFLRSELGWLRGIPLGQPGDGRLPWRTVPRLQSPDAAATLGIDRERLRAAEFARNTARRRFPKALPRVVGDVDAWSARIDAQLDILKRCVHAGAAFPHAVELIRLAGFRASLERQLLERLDLEPDLAPLFGALVWFNWHEPSELLAELGRIPVAAIRQVMRRVEAPLPIALLLVQLAAGARPAYLFELIASDAVWTLPCPSPELVSDIQSFVARVPEHARVETRFVTSLPGWPPPSLGDELVGYAARLHGVDGKARDRQARLLAVLMPAARLEIWQTWWETARRLEQRGQHLDGRLVSDLQPAEWQLLKQIYDDIAEMPAPPTAWNNLLYLLPPAGDIPRAAFDELIGCAQWLAEGDPDPRRAQRFCDSWVASFKWYPHGALAKALTALRNITQAMPRPVAEQQDWLVDVCDRALCIEWLDAKRPHRLLPLVTTALIDLIAPPRPWHARGVPQGPYDVTWATLLDAVAALGDPHLVARAIVAVPPDWGHLYGRLWLTLLRAADDDPDGFAELARTWPADAVEYALHGEIERSARDAAFRDLLRDAARHGEIPRLATVLRLTVLCRRLGLAADVSAPLVVSEPPDWLSIYPAALHPLLAALVREDARAKPAIDDILGDDFPLPEKTAAERAALVLRLARERGAKQDTLRKRLARLDRLASEPPVLTPRRLANLAAKLERRLLHARLERMNRASILLLQAGLSASLGVVPTQAWLERRDVSSMLVALPALDARFRSLAFRLLGRGLGVSPPDLREEAPNSAFLERLQRRGIHTAPWLDGIAPQSLEIAGQTLTLAIDRDPLAVMGMGGHFGTCLSPGDVNFFSAVANAADINKAVIFARDAGGVVQARCLIALDDDGRIVTFHVYAHAHADALATAMHAYISALAVAMGTSLAAAGSIRTLVAHRWYDDGPRDLTGQLEFLSDHSDFRRGLARIPLQELVRAVHAAMGPGHDLTPVVAWRIVQCAEIGKRPELVLPLLPYFGDLERLEFHWLEGLAPLLRRAGELSAARAVTDILAARTLRLPYPAYQFVAAEEYIELGLPHLALSQLRRTRPPRVRDWQDEDVERVLIAARALRALGRPHRALELARIAAAKDAHLAAPLLSQLTAELAAQSPPLPSKRRQG